MKPSAAPGERPVAVANRHPRLQFERRAVQRMVAMLDAIHSALATPRSILANHAELSVVFLTDGELAELHARYLEDPTVTDVITFEGTPTLGIAGEICVSADAARRQIRAASDQMDHHPSPSFRAPAAFSRELALYVVHGWLHLAGYDDVLPAKKRAMRRAEARAMAYLERAHALPDFRLERAKKIARTTICRGGD